MHKMTLLYTIALVFAQCSLNIIYVAQASLVPDVCTEAIGKASGLVAIMQCTGNVLGMLVFVVWSFPIQAAYLLFGLFVLSVAVVVCLTVEEESTLERPEKPLTQFAILNTFRMRLHGTERDFVWVLMGRMFYYAATAIQTFVYYYFRDLLLEPAEDIIRQNVGILVIIAMAVGLLVTYPAGQFSDKYGRKIFIYVACLGMALVYMGYIFAPLLGPRNGLYVVWALGGCFGAGTGCYLAVDYAMALDCMPKGANARGSSEALGLWGISSFIGSALGPLITGIILELAGQGQTASGMGGYSFRGYAAILLMGIAFCTLSGFVTSFIARAK